MITNTLFTFTYKQNELGKSMLFTFVKSRITPGRTSMSHYMLDNFRTYKDSSPECWSYFFFTRRYNDEIKWWKQTCLDFNNNHCSCNICSYTSVGLCFDVCGSTLSTKNLEEHCTENSQEFTTGVRKMKKKFINLNQKIGLWTLRCEKRVPFFIKNFQIPPITYFTATVTVLVCNNLLNIC